MQPFLIRAEVLRSKMYDWKRVQAFSITLLKCRNMKSLRRSAECASYLHFIIDQAYVYLDARD